MTTSDDRELRDVPVAAIVLAAGLGSRFRAQDPTLASKLLAKLDGRALVRRAVEAALVSQARPVVVVTGHAAAEVRNALVGLPVQFVHNPAFASGLASSLKAGLAAVPDAAAGALVLLGDMPRLSPATLDRLIAAFRAHPACAAVVPVHAGERGNPALLARRIFKDLNELRGDQGARPLLPRLGEEVLECEAGADVLFDVDDPARLRQPP